MKVRGEESRTEASNKVVRVTHRTELPFDELVRRLRRRLGTASPKAIAEASRDARSEIEFEARMWTMLGASGFTILSEIDHGAWARPLGLKGGLIRWVIGHPILSLHILRLDPEAGLFTPPELLVTEHVSDCTVSYIRPSSQITGGPELARLAKDLDTKLEAFLTSAFEEI